MLAQNLWSWSARSKATLLLLVLVIWITTGSENLMAQSFDGSEVDGATVEDGPLPRLVTYDVQTGREVATEQEPGALSATALPDLPYDAGAGEPADVSDESVPSSILQPAGASDFGLVAKPASYPWRANVKLFAHFTYPHSEHVKECSGSLIDPRVVLTSGNCLLIGILDGSGNSKMLWADWVRVVPTYSKGTAPFGEAYATRLHSWWPRTGSDNDIGFAELGRPVGALAGWLGLRYNDNDEFFRTTSWSNCGYPTQPPYSGQEMYCRDLSYDNVTRHTLETSVRAFTNAAGSTASHENYCSAIYSYTVFSGSGAATRDGFTRVTGDKFSQIVSTIRETTPSQVDLIALSARISPSGVVAGQSLASLRFWLHNYSSAAWKGSINLRAYLSTDDRITTTDRLLATTKFEGSLAAKQGIWVTMPPPVIPSRIQGRYWIGIIIDTADYDASNNSTSGWWDATQIQVSATRVYLPGVVRR